MNNVKYVFGAYPGKSTWRRGKAYGQNPNALRINHRHTGVAIRGKGGMMQFRGILSRLEESRIKIGRWQVALLNKSNFC